MIDINISTLLLTIATITIPIIVALIIAIWGIRKNKKAGK